ncbi:hypothetical protein BJAS_P4259 [Bathymodiolus japonicus methanotrophic gill symbiont]|nr:hypothetical protein BJAS_P4259 [Bathymodiolus japonicus methanotrophic gill symbiont]
MKEEALADIKEPAPDQITEQLTDLGSNLWGFAQSLATDHLKSEREALEVARGEFEAIASEAGELADALSLELEEEAKKLEETTDKHDDLVTINSELLTKTEDQDKEIKNLSLSVTNLEDKAKGFEDSNKELSKENAKLSGHIGELDKEKKDNLSKINKLNNQVGSLEADLRNANENNASEIANLNNAYKEKEKVIKKQMDDALKAKHTAEKALSDRINKELNDLEEKNKSYVALVEKQEKLRDELDKVRTDRDACKNQINLLKTKNDEQKKS